MKTAVMVVAYARPHYFHQVLESLERNPESEQLPFWFFLDHGPAEGRQTVEEIVKACKIRDKTLVRRQENFGTGRNIIDGLRRLFDIEEYERVLVFEDDMIVNPQYIRLVLWLSERYHRYANVGTVQAHAQDRRDQEQQRRDLHRLCVTTQHFWGYCLTKRVWDLIKPYVLEYESLFLEGIGNYRERDHTAIRKWMRTTLGSGQRTPKAGTCLRVPERFSLAYHRRINLGHLYRWLRRFTRNAEWARAWVWRFHPTPTGQDSVMNLALQIEGFTRLTTRVPRTQYIGELGEHSNREQYRHQGWPESRTFEWAEDEAPRDFRLPWE